jgi:hypothetical protein
MCCDSAAPQNNKMQRTKHGRDGASPLILVFCGPLMKRAKRSSVLRTAIGALLALVISSATAEERPKEFGLVDLAGRYWRYDVVDGRFWTLVIRRDGTFTSSRFVGSVRDIRQPREGVASVSNGSLFLVVPPGDEQYVLTPATFGTRLYLLQADRELGFCIDVAEGREPRKSATGEALIRQGDEKVAVPQNVTPAVCREPGP